MVRLAELTRRLLLSLFALAAGATAYAAPSYRGTFVVIDPYSASDVAFLKCATQATPTASCSNQSASKAGFSNPFTSGGANGILLRVPWCGFQIGPAAGQPPFPGPGQCHYQLQGDVNTAATDIAGSFTGTGAMQFAQQGAVDVVINNLSLCSGAGAVYDECASSVLAVALGYIGQINASLNHALMLSVALVAGQYTPQSVMTAPGIGWIDLSQKNNTVRCTRQPLAWQTAFAQAYVAALDRLISDVATLSGAPAPAVVILKDAAIVSNSIEFDVAARTTIDPTAIDAALPPGGNGIGPQGDAALQCPDQTQYQSGVNALLGRYATNGVRNTTLALAYEATFGYVTGYESGLLARHPGRAAILSIPIKGSQEFAHVSCGTSGVIPCVADPSPIADQYDWSEFYFTKFVKDLFINSAPAHRSAEQGFAAACKGHACTPSTYTLTPWQLALVYTGLQTPNTLVGGYPSLPSCWLNNINLTNAGNTATLTLHSTWNTSTSKVIVGPAPKAQAPGGGTMLGWQTSTSLGLTCYGSNPSYAATLQDAIANGGQFLEVETDAAAEPTCGPALRTALAQVIGGNGAVGCVY